MAACQVRQAQIAERGSEENYSDNSQVLSSASGKNEIQFGPDMLHITFSGQLQQDRTGLPFSCPHHVTTTVEGQPSHNILDQFGSHDTAEALCRTQFGQSGFVFNSNSPGADRRAGFEGESQ